MPTFDRQFSESFSPATERAHDHWAMNRDQQGKFAACLVNSWGKDRIHKLNFHHSSQGCFVFSLCTLRGDVEHRYELRCYQYNSENPAEYREVENQADYPSDCPISFIEMVRGNLQTEFLLSSAFHHATIGLPPGYIIQIPEFDSQTRRPTPRYGQSLGGHRFMIDGLKKEISSTQLFDILSNYGVAKGVA